MRAFLALALAASALGQASPPSPPLAHIAVTASDARGRVVADLRSEEVEIVQGGGPLAVETVRFITADGGADESPAPIRSRADEQAEAAREGARLFAIFLDEYHVSAGAGVERVREALVRFVEQDLGPRDLVVVVKPLDSLLNLRLTRDHDAVARAIKAFDGRKGDYTPRTAFERDYVAGATARIAALRAQIATSALHAIAVHLGTLSVTRKAIVVVSEGFASGQRRRGDGELPTVDAAIRAAGRSNASFYAIDPGALASAAGAPADPAADGSPDSSSEASERGTLRRLAAETGGQAIFTPAALAAGLTRVISESTGYYVIAFRRPHDEAPADLGQFHAIQLRATRPGVRLEGPQGYWAPSFEDLMRARAAEQAAAPPPPPELPPRRSPLIRPWFGLARGAEGRTRVSFVWEPVAAMPGAPRRAQAPARITLKASQADGTPVFEGTVRSASAFVAGAPNDEPSLAVFEAPPGRLRVQMTIEGADKRLLDTDVREVVVGALAGPVALGTAEVLRAQSARLYRALEADPGAAPVAAREFSRAERLLIRVRAYAALGAPEVSARLLSTLGSAMRDLPVTRGPGPDLHQVDLPLAGLAAGEYRIELVVRSGGGEAAQAVTFRVMP